MNFAAVLVLLAAASVPPSLPKQLAFLQGCWAGQSGNSTIEESYSSLRGDLILGHVKTLQDKHVVFFEFLKIIADSQGTWFEPFPKGRNGAPRFRLVEVDAGHAIFENPAHDFPQRIAFRLLPDGQLLTRVTGVEATKPVVQEYTTAPRSCVAGNDGTSSPARFGPPPPLS